jgi:hypothetical protein
VRPRSFAEFQHDYLADAVALVRPYPPHREPAGRSHIGGLPDLPIETAWPRAENGLPLHFLAQIDLAEMPWLPPAMPRQGTLLFFGAMGKDDYVSMDPGGARVLFDARSEGTPTPLPPDMPARASGYDFDLDPKSREKDARGYPYWPLKGYHILSMPDPQGLDDNAYSKAEYADYCAAYPAFKMQEVRRATGMPAPKGELWQPMPVFSVTEHTAPHHLRAYDETGFPWTGRGLALIAGQLLSLKGWQVSDKQREELAEFQLQGEAALRKRVNPADAERFIATLNTIMEENLRTVEERGRTRVYKDEVGASIGMAVRTLVTESGADPVLAQAIPDEVYEACYPWHSPFAHHQMFGYVGAAQTPMPATSDTMTLLQLAWDGGVHMTFGDGGELDFRISPEALAACDWNKVEVSSTSH